MFSRQGRSGFLQWFKGIQLPQHYRAWLARLTARRQQAAPRGKLDLEPLDGRFMPNDLVGAVTSALAGSALASGFHPIAQTESRTQTYQQDARLSQTAPDTHSNIAPQHDITSADARPWRMPPATPTPGTSSNPLASPLASNPVAADPLASDFLDRVGQALHQPPTNCAGRNCGRIRCRIKAV